MAYDIVRIEKYRNKRKYYLIADMLWQTERKQNEIYILRNRHTVFCLVVSGMDGGNISGYHKGKRF